MNLIESSKPFARTRDDAPARWLLDILWLVLATGEDTNGELSVVEQFMPVFNVSPFGDQQETSSHISFG